MTDQRDVGVRVTVRKTFMHPMYETGSKNDLSFDICLMNTDPLDLSSNVLQAVCLPDENDHVEPDDAGKITQCYIAGWGSLGFEIC